MCLAGVFIRRSLLRPVWFRLGLGLAALLMLSGAPKSFALTALGDRGILLRTLYCFPGLCVLWENALGSPQVRFPPLSGVFNMISES